VLKHPVQQGFLEAYVTTLLFTFNPLVPQNLFALREELPIEGGTLEEVGPIRG
jgi:hypothetical protein